MEQVKQFHDSYNSFGSTYAHDVWDWVNPFLKAHAKQNAHVVNVETEPSVELAGTDRKEVVYHYRVVSVAYDADSNDDSEARLKQQTKRYQAYLDHYLKVQLKPQLTVTPQMIVTCINKLQGLLKRTTDSNGPIDAPGVKKFWPVKLGNVLISRGVVSYTLKIQFAGQTQPTHVHGAVKF